MINITYFISMQDAFLNKGGVHVYEVNSAYYEWLIYVEIEHVEDIL